MKKLLFGAAAALIAFGATATPRADRLQSDRLFPFAPKAKASLTAAGRQAGPMKTAAVRSLPQSDASGYLNGPKGATWFFTMEYKGETVDHGGYTEQMLTGFRLTVYDDKFQEVGTVEDTIELQEGETKIAQFSIGPDITQKFFNYDNEFEIMMGVAFNTEDYVNTYRTYAYSIGKNERIATFDGYYCSAVDSATDAWSEKFWITFMTEEETQTPDVNGVLNMSDYRFRTYKAAGYSGMGDAVVDVRFPSVTLAGADAIPFLANVDNGLPYFAVNHLKYSWYENPYDYSNENPTADNELQIHIYAPASAWASTVDHYCTTSIPMNPTVDDLYFMYIGNFGYDDDLNFKVNGDGTPALYITRAHSTQGGDTFACDFEVYSAAPKGQTAQGVKKFTVAEGTGGGTFMADIDGYAPQVMFIVTDAAENMSFRFVNPLTGETEHELDPFVDPENPEVSLTSQTNRLPRNGSYVYYAPQTRGASDGQGQVKTSVIFVDPETGRIVDTDDISLGSDVEYAQLYAGTDAFDPYIFNLDDTREYMALVKRTAPNGSGVVEELMVASADPAKGTLLTVGPDEVKGNLASVFLANLDGEKPRLVVIYQNTANWKITLDSHELPLVSFENGDGTPENPYEISSVGGLKQIHTAPEAHYAVVSDINADGYVLTQKNFDFKGSLDGRGHTVSNLGLSGYALIPSMSRDPQAPADSPNARVVNLNFLNPVFDASRDEQGLLLGHMTGGLVDNVHVYGGTVTSDQSVAGLVGQASLYGSIRNSSFNGDITTSDNSAGGIVINTMTSATVRACAFKGSITGGQAVGGIAGMTLSNAGEVADCHVNARIKGTNTVGGIVGNSARSVIRNCHVQGSLEATEAPRWGGGPKLGGIVGQLDRSYGNPGDETGEGDTQEPEAVIQGCYVNLTSMTFSGTLQDEEYAGQNDTMHRIVGWSSVNDTPEETGYDEETWEPIYGDPAPAETALKDNYAVATLAAAHEDFENSPASTEGASVDADRTGIEFFQNLGWLYGYDFENPWNMTGDQFNPSLYFEGGLLVLTPADVTVKVDEEVALSLRLEGEKLTEEMLEGFTCELSDESIAEVGNVEQGADGEIVLTVKGLKEGSAALTCGLNGKTAKAVITVEKKEESGIGNVAAGQNPLRFDGRNVYADGCMIEVYSSTGARVLTGSGSLSLHGLQGGVYIVTAVDAEGNRSSLKVSVR